MTYIVLLPGQTVCIVARHDWTRKPAMQIRSNEWFPCGTKLGEIVILGGFRFIADRIVDGALTATLIGTESPDVHFYAPETGEIKCATPYARGDSSVIEGMDWRIKTAAPDGSGESQAGR